MYLLLARPRKDKNPENSGAVDKALGTLHRLICISVTAILNMMCRGLQTSKTAWEGNKKLSQSFGLQLG